MTRRTRFALTGALVVLGACQDLPDPTAPLGGAPTPQFARVAQQEGGPDRMALARAVPGFAGIFFENGQPTVALTDVGQQPAAERVLEAFLRGRGFGAGALRVRQARWDYESLDAWFERISPAAFEAGGIVFVDLNETRNGIVIGVEDGGRAPNLRAIAARLGIPDEAIAIEQAAPIERLASLRDPAAQITGGLQINFPGYLCTLGFVAVGGGENSFITNSHCTNTQGGTEGTPYWQPLSSAAPEQMGIEVHDPTYFSCGGGRVCRYSDAARIRQLGSRPFARGVIAKPVSQGGNLTIGGAFTIVGKAGSGCAVEGTTIHKVGRTTGWTSGPITNSCVNVGVSGTNITQLSQVLVTAVLNSGDSGSPAFSVSSGDNVILEGIVWGGGGSTMVYSPISNIESELGPLTVTGDGGGPGPTAPSTPGNFRVTSTTTSSIALAWNDVSGEDRYELTRSGGPTSQLGANQTSYSDGGLAAGTQYSYSLVACNSAGCSQPATTSGATQAEVSGTMHVSVIDGSSNVKGRSGKWSASATVTIVDGGNVPVSGATVFVTWSGDDNGSASGATNGSGQVTFTTGNMNGGSSVTFQVTNATHPSLTFEPGSSDRRTVIK